MSDELVSALLPEGRLRVILALTTGLARQGCAAHGCAPVAAQLFSRGLTAGLLVASLQKESTRLNLQLTCDGPLRGLFVDASSEGEVRGYVNYPLVTVAGNPGGFQWRPALGNAGQLSVLRDLGRGEYYRSSVELERFDVAGDLERYFAASEQLTTRVWLEAQPTEGELLGRVAGMLLQPLPDGDPEFFRAAAERLSAAGGFASILAAHPEADAETLLRAMFADTQVDFMARQPLVWRCRCSREGVLRAVQAMGRPELEDVLRTDKRVEATCHFCNTQYVVEEAELRELLAAVPS